VKNNRTRLSVQRPALGLPKKTEPLLLLSTGMMILLACLAVIPPSQLPAFARSRTPATSRDSVILLLYQYSVSQFLQPQALRL
jgi:Na+-transporting methylmalonyl-CoA/oxaloacetate decarboxylase beta subunit